MRIVIDNGHGLNYLGPCSGLDVGHVNERGVTEASVGEEYRKIFLKEGRKRGHGMSGFSARSMGGTIAHRIRIAAKEADFLLGLHMGLDISGEPGQRVRVGVPNSYPLAQALAEALNVPWEAVSREEGTLRVNHSVEIELGNIACQQDMRMLSSTQYAQALANKVLDVLESFEISN